MDDGAGAAVGTFVVVGSVYLLAEFLALALAAAAIGALFGAVLVLVCAGSAAKWVVRNPRPPSAKAWALFAGASSSMVAAPFGVMWIAAGGTNLSADDSSAAVNVLGPLCFIGLCAAVVYGIPTLYRYCSALAMADWPAPPRRTQAVVHASRQSQTPDRVLFVERLAASGAIDGSYAGRISANGHVSDADWALLQRFHGSDHRAEAG